MEKQHTEEVIEENNIKGYFTLSSGIEVPFKMSDDNIIIGELVLS